MIIQIFIKVFICTLIVDDSYFNPVLSPSTEVAGCFSQLSSEHLSLYSVNIFKKVYLSIFSTAVYFKLGLVVC